MVTLDEVKLYLRVDSSDEDALLQTLIQASLSLCLAVSRMESLEEAGEIASLRMAVLYGVAYLYEHREEADHTALNLTLRSLLSDVRRSEF